MFLRWQGWRIRFATPKSLTLWKAESPSASLAGDCPGIMVLVFQGLRPQAMGERACVKSCHSLHPKDCYNHFNTISFHFKSQVWTSLQLNISFQFPPESLYLWLLYIKRQLIPLNRNNKAYCHILFTTERLLLTSNHHSTNYHKGEFLTQNRFCYTSRPLNPNCLSWSMPGIHAQTI